MNIDTLKILSCPKCSGRFITDVKEEKEKDIWKASMYCTGCNEYYIVEDGNPNLKLSYRGIPDLMSNHGTLLSVPNIKINIIIAYNEYKYDSRYRPTGEYDKNELIRAIKFLNKNSYSKHNILIITNNDDLDDLFKEFDNVKIMKSKYIHRGDPSSIPYFRYNAALIEGINNIPDDEWICYAFLADTICSKDWDKYIIDAMQKYGDNVYIPMFVEIRDRAGTISLIGIDPTSKNIWDEWRRTVSCHYLTMPVPTREYITEEDVNYFIKRANEAGKIIIIESPGDRIYGFFYTMIMKTKFAKKVLKLDGPGFDIKFDDRLRDDLHMLKIVVARSFIFHPNCQFK